MSWNPQRPLWFHLDLLSQIGFKHTIKHTRTSMVPSLVHPMAHLKFTQVFDYRWSPPLLNLFDPPCSRRVMSPPANTVVPYMVSNVTTSWLASPVAVMLLRTTLCAHHFVSVSTSTDLGRWFVFDSAIQLSYISMNSSDAGAIRQLNIPVWWSIV